MIALITAALLVAESDPIGFTVGLNFSPSALVSASAQERKPESGMGKGIFATLSLPVTPNNSARIGLSGISYSSEKRIGNAQISVNPGHSHLSLGWQVKPSARHSIVAYAGLTYGRFTDNLVLRDVDAPTWAGLSRHIVQGGVIGGELGVDYTFDFGVALGFKYNYISLDKSRTGLSNMGWASFGVGYHFGRR